MTEPLSAEHLQAAEVQAVLRQAVEFLLTQEMARLEHSVRGVAEHARARDLRRQLHLAGSPGL